jgi:glycosyltransferase involved in cell wall biosynthesis
MLNGRHARSRLLVICGAGYVSGKEIMALELGQALAQAGESVSFVTSYWNDGDFVGRLSRLKVPAHILPIGFISATLTKECVRMTAEQVWRWPELLWNYTRLLRTQKPDRVIHTNWHHLLLLLPFVRPDRDLYWVHELMPDSARYRRVFYWFERRLACFVCVSEAVAQSLRRIGVSERKIRIVRNGLQDPAGAFEPVPVRDGAFRIGIVGQVGPWKGHADLLEAFALVRSKYRNAELHIFGAGDRNYQTELLRRSVSLKVDDAVTWHGFVSDQRQIYDALDACVVPSRIEEPFGLAALEPLFFKLPVIASRRGGLPEIVEHEVNGLLVDAEIPGQIANALCRLIEQPQFRSMLADNGRQLALKRFGRERFLNDFLQVLAA